MTSTLKTRGIGHGYADARTALSNYLGGRHPELKPLNADTSVWIKAVDVLQAAEEAERVRPTVGRSLMARGLGAATGAAGGGVAGAVTGAVVGPVVERVVASAGPAVKLTVARQLAKLADALRSGNQAQASALLKGLDQMVPATAAVNAAQTGGPVRFPQAAESGSKK